MDAALPPRRVGAAVSELRKAMQAALSARRSRLSVNLPDGARLGLEKGDAIGEASNSLVQGDRELARCLVALFEGTGLSVCTIFSTVTEMNMTAKRWGPLVECNLDCWEAVRTGSSPSASAARKAKRRARRGPPQTKTTSAREGGGGFGAVRRDVDDSTPSKLAVANSPGEMVSQGEFDVYIVVSPRKESLAKVMKLCNRFGDDKLVVLANARVHQMDGLSKSAASFFADGGDSFEDVYLWRPDPSREFSGGVLYRAFPNDYVLCRQTPVGVMQRLLEAEQLPSDADITQALRDEASKPTTGLLNRVAGLLDRRSS